MLGRGRVLYGEVRCVLVRWGRQGKAWHGKARCVEARRGTLRLGRRGKQMESASLANTVKELSKAIKELTKAVKNLSDTIRTEKHATSEEDDGK